MLLLLSGVLIRDISQWLLFHSIIKSTLHGTIVNKQARVKIENFRGQMNLISFGTKQNKKITPIKLNNILCKFKVFSEAQTSLKYLADENNAIFQGSNKYSVQRGHCTLTL